MLAIHRGEVCRPNTRSNGDSRPSRCLPGGVTHSGRRRSTGSRIDLSTIPTMSRVGELMVGYLKRVTRSARCGTPHMSVVLRKLTEKYSLIWTE